MADNLDKYFRDNLGKEQVPFGPTLWEKAAARLDDHPGHPGDAPLPLRRARRHGEEQAGQQARGFGDHRQGGPQIERVGRRRRTAGD